MQPEVIREGVAAALLEVLQDDDILRDLFAAFVAAGIAANPQENRTLENVSEGAYAVADAMLEARKKPAPKTKKR